MARDSRAFRVYAALVGFLTVTAAAVLAVRADFPPAGGLVLFCLLMIYSEHRSVEFAEGSVVNADFMVIMASIVAFQDVSPILGPALVGASRAIYLPQLRARQWSLVSLQAGSALFGAIAGAAALQAFPDAGTAGMPGVLVAAAVSAVALVFVLWVVLAPAFVMRGQSFRSVIGNFAPRAAESLPFSLLGFFLGQLYLGIGGYAVLMLIVPMFIAREVFASYMKVKDTHEETVQVLVRALEAKDRYTAGHAGRVADYSRYIGEELNFMPARLERLRFAALMHDIGKLVVPNQLLNKPGRLTAEEFARVRVHESVSVQMLSHIDFLRPIAKVSHSDHTRFDPDDTDHPIEPYIVMIADAYDAMTSTRSYRKALPQELAFQELREKSGVQFHPECVEALIRAVERRGEKHGAGFEETEHFEDAPVVGLGSAGLGDLLPSDAT
jgi:HD superfamily phosphodiesterase